MDEIERRDDKGVQRGAARGFGALLATGLAAAGGWIVYSQTMIDHNLPLPLAVNSERHLFTSDEAGLLNYYVDAGAEGRSLVLIHSVNAAASAYEMRPLFTHYQGKRPVYALDLPGFGFSERSNRPYTPVLFAAAIRDFLYHVVGEAADVVALSLGGEFAARAARENPQLFHSLVLISPTGLAGKGHVREEKSDGGGWLLQVTGVPWLGQALFDLLVTRPSINYFLNKSFQGPMDKGLAAYGYLSGHQPGARFAPLAFIGGRLFTPNARFDLYEQLSLPAIVVYDEDPYSSFDGLPDLLLAHPNWSAVRITPTRGLPHFEQPETTVRVLDNFWQRLRQ